MTAMERLRNICALMCGTFPSKYNGHVPHFYICTGSNQIQSSNRPARLYRKKSWEGSRKGELFDGILKKNFLELWDVQFIELFRDSNTLAIIDIRVQLYTTRHLFQLVSVYN